MDYELLSYVFIALSLGIIFGTMIGKKKMLVLALILDAFSILVLLMKAVDYESYMDIFYGIEKIDLFVCVYSLLSLVITILLAILKKSKLSFIEVVDKNDDGMGNKLVIRNLDDKLYYFNLMNIDYAYYLNDKDVFILNNSFRKSLNEGRIELKSQEFFKLMKEEDYQVYSSLSSNEYTFNFRMFINNSYEWYEMVSVMNGNNNIKIVYRVDNKLGSDARVGNYKDLESDISAFNKKQEDYGLALLNIYSIMDMNLKRKEYYKENEGNEILDKDLRSVIIAKYITKLLSGHYKGQIKVYRISNMEYAFLILNKRAYDTFERELYTNVSEFIRCDIVLNNLKVLVRSKLGLVYSKHVKLSGNYQVINAAFDMLQMIISSSYKQDYAIYQNSSKTYNNYKLKDMGIDLENDLKNCLSDESNED